MTVVVGHNYGAIRFATLDGFYEAQRVAAEAIVRGVHEVACASWDGRPRGTTPTIQDLNARMGAYARDYDRPHNVFTIDGPRGSGKTTLLQTLSGFLSLMRLDCDRIRPGNEGEESVRDGLRALRLKPPRNDAGNRRTALVLPIVFTEDMDPLETTMEAVFAQLEARLDDELTDPTCDKATLSKLRADLRREVGVAWTFAQRIGAEALSQDALDYADFVERRADFNRRAYTRISTWRRFVDVYLDALGYELLVPLLDDSDLNPHVAEDILRSVRMYFSHPRIATVLAVEIENMAWTLFARGLTAEHRSLAALRTLDSGILNGFVGQVDANAEALLDKVLPMNLRHDLRPTSLEHIDHFFKRDDCGLGEPTDSFESWCRKHHHSAADSDDRFAWFLLAGPYRRLAGANVRQVVAFRDATATSGSKPLQALLRVNSMRDFAQKISRNVLELDWLIESGRLGPRWEENENDEDDEILSKEEAQFADLYVDVRIARSSLAVAGSPLVRRWLPDGLPEDRSSLGSADDPARLGVAECLREIPLPRNCLYIHHLRRLSGVSFTSLPSASLWALWLAGIAPSPSEEQLRRLRQAAQDVASVASGSDAEVLGWFALRIQVLRAVGRTATVEFEQDALNFVVALYALTRRSVTSRAQFAHRLAKMAAGNEEEEIVSFLTGLAEVVGQSERRRQEVAFTWAAALELAGDGDDNQRVERPQPRTSLVIPLVATAPQPRLPELVDRTVAVMKRRDRPAVLLAWSLCPLLKDVHDYGLDYEDRSTSLDAWTRLVTAFRELADDLSDASRQDGGPVADLPDGSAVAWVFADMTLKELQDIYATVVEARNRFDKDLVPEEAAGVLRARRSWQTWHADHDLLVASVLGTSRQWARENVVAEA